MEQISDLCKELSTVTKLDQQGNPIEKQISRIRTRLLLPDIKIIYDLNNRIIERHTILPFHGCGLDRQVQVNEEGC